MVNEALTVNIVREHFRNSKCKIEEKQSSNPRIQKLLKQASKSGNGSGYPEFIISDFPDVNNFVIVIECKADTLKHESPDHDKYKDYAVDGAILYASYLSKEFDVLALAVSGETKEMLKVSHYLQLKGSGEQKEVFDNILLPIEDYISGYKHSKEVTNKPNPKDMTKVAKEMNNRLHGMKIPENQRALLISAILIALKRKSFIDDYGNKEKSDLPGYIVLTIENQLKGEIPLDKLKKLMAEFNFIKTNSSLNNETSELKEIIKIVNDDIFIHMDRYQDDKAYDFIGQLYIEFLKYANSDASLGIVLTPSHITELFCELARVNKDSVLLDNCTGTAGFLITGMQKMITDAKGNKDKIDDIKKNQMIGIEYMSHIYALAASNMIIHNDGKTNLLYGSCFETAIINKAKLHKPNIGMLNPPYKSQDADPYEMEFILNNLSMLEKNGVCIALIPMSCILAQKGKEREFKENLLKEHTLEAVLSLPDELFVNSKVGVVTCAIIIKAHQPHPKDYKTFFGYCKEDGFFKKKVGGRGDYDGKWSKIKKLWINSFINREVISGFSVTKYVTADDEWCAEAYMETDYSKITKEDFIKAVKDFVVFEFSNNIISSATDNCINLNIKIELNILQWKYYKLIELFKIEKMNNISISKDEIDSGKYLLLSSIDSNNGMTGKINREPHQGNVITYNNNGSIGITYYQPLPFCSTGDVSIFNPLFKLNQYIGLFLVTILNVEKYRYNYGRKAGSGRLENIQIKLPSKPDGTPDFEFMENYIKSLPYSSSL